MATINPHFDKLVAKYIFDDVQDRTKAFEEAHSGIQVIKLGVGNTTEGLPLHAVRGIERKAAELKETKTYTGYGNEQGEEALRKAIAEFFHSPVEIDPTEIFVSDGAKSDSASIQFIFSLDNVVALQTPSYPVYERSNVIVGRTGEFNETSGGYEGMVYMECNAENGFFPELPEERVDLIYICSPNNPTGAVATKDQLKRLVDYARDRKAVIIFDAAYSAFIKDENLPKSIYEVEGAKECAIEINSFSKYAGFTGVRLGWTVVPKELVVEGTEPGKIHELWSTWKGTFFNGASNVAQAGGLDVISSPEGRSECEALVNFYMENAGILRKTLKEKGLTVFGGDNAPYLWVRNPGGVNSWDFSKRFLTEAHVEVTPGSGFGDDKYIRFSAFGHRDDIEEANKRIELRFNL